MRSILSTQFADLASAEAAADALRAAGVDPDDISVVPLSQAPEHDAPVRAHGGPSGRIQERGERTPKRGGFYGLLAGGVIGAALGWLGAQLPMTIGVFTAMGWGLGLGALAGLAAGITINANLPTITDPNLPRPEVHGHTAVHVQVGSLSEEEIRDVLEAQDPLGFDTYKEELDVRKRVADATGMDAPKGVVAG